MFQCFLRLRAGTFLATSLLLVALAKGQLSGGDPLPRALTNDNRVAAGKLENGALHLTLEMAKTDWYPEAERGPHIPVYAFAEAGKSPMIPGPLIRVPRGTRIHATVRNTLSEPMAIHGLFTRPGEDVPVTLAPGEQHDFEFAAGAPGTYLYWAAPPGATLRAGVDQRLAESTQLSGAFVVDDESAAPADRIFVLGIWRDWDDRQHFQGIHEFVTVNGKSWPYTERLKQAVGEIARWRIINASSGIHPMHMHGAYYRVISRGDFTRDTPLAPDQQPMVVTELMRAGTTLTMEWSPDRPGHWLFHCHLMGHLDPKRSLTAIRQHWDTDEAHDSPEHSGMVGLVLGIDVEGKPRLVQTNYRRAHKLVLEIAERKSDPLEVNILLHDGKTVSQSQDLVGPPIVLRRGQPTEITVINRLSQPTAIHWHGMELESYYDGVPGFSGLGRQITPLIPPGGKFVARMTPPRAGTFIYHTHWHDVQQLRGGLNGGLLVLEDGRFDPAVDKLFVAAWGTDDHQQLIVNGLPSLLPIDWQAGQPYRVRLINIGPTAPVQFTLSPLGSKPLKWRSLAKDGMELPPAQQHEQDAMQLVAVGETHDFGLPALSAGDYKLQARILPLAPLVKEQIVELLIHVRAQAVASR